jgi:hypothetical protein
MNPSMAMKFIPEGSAGGGGLMGGADTSAASYLDSIGVPGATGGEGGLGMSGSGAESALGSAAGYAGTALAAAAFLKAAKDSGAMDKNMEVLEDMWQGPKDLGNRTKDMAAKMKFWEWF